MKFLLRVIAGRLVERYFIKPIPRLDWRVAKKLFALTPKDSQWHKVAYRDGPYTISATVKAEGIMAGSFELTADRFMVAVGGQPQ